MTAEHLAPTENLRKNEHCLLQGYDSFTQI